MKLDGISEEGAQAVWQRIVEHAGERLADPVFATRTGFLVDDGDGAASYWKLDLVDDLASRHIRDREHNEAVELYQNGRQVARTEAVTAHAGEPLEVTYEGDGELAFEVVRRNGVVVARSWARPPEALPRESAPKASWWRRLRDMLGL